jgi:DnaJ-class molecular chaperone
MKKDLYQALGLSPDASEEEIKKAFRRAALLYHPDRNLSNPEVEERFKEVNHAYSILGSREKRGRYDLYREFRANASRLGFGASHTYDRLLEELFLNTSIPLFPRGFPFNAAIFERLGPLLFFPRASLVFVSRFVRELQRGKAMRPSRSSRLGALREAVRQRGGSVQSRFGASSRSDSAGATTGPGEDRAFDHRPAAAAGDLEWVLHISPQEAEMGTWLNVAYAEDSRWQRLRLRVPAGLRDGTRLRVKSKGGPARGERGRGDLYFRIFIG